MDGDQLDPGGLGWTHQLRRVLELLIPAQAHLQGGGAAAGLFHGADADISV